MFLLVCLISWFVRSDEYIGIKIFSSNDCIESNIIDSWLTQPGKNCDRDYLDSDLRSKAEISGDRKSVKYSLYYDGSCQHLNTTVFYPLNTCIKSKVGRGISGVEFFVNFTIYETFPIDLETEKVWLVSENFLDEECQKPVVHESEGNTVDAYSPTYDLFTHNFCSEEVMVEQLTLDQKGGKIEMQYIPRALEGGCLKRYLYRSEYNTNRYGSIRFKCMSQTEIEENYLKYFPKKSSHKYLMRTSSYDEHCSTNFKVRLFVLDDCTETLEKMGEMQIGDQNQSIHIFFEHMNNCSHPSRFSIWRNDVGRSYYNVCMSSGVDMMDKDYKVFSTSKLSDDPYETAQVANTYSYKYTDCNEDMTDFMKNPNSGYIEYLDREYCSGSGNYLETTEAQSFKGRCENGKMIVDVFPDSRICYGMYHTIEVDTPSSPNPFCHHMSWIGLTYRLMCIPRYCGDYNELEPEVCNGHGRCYFKDLCECNGGYEGNLCEKWYCFGISHLDKTTTCNGHGKCIKPNICSCQIGWSTSTCDRSDHIERYEIIGIVATSIIIPLFIFLFFCFGICCLFFCCLLGCCCLLVFTIGIFSIFQTKKVKMFERLEDFDVLYQEQEISKNKNFPNIKINKKLFEINYDEIKIIKVIGEGGSDAFVFLGTWKGAQIAFKCFKTRKLCSTQERFDQFEAEVALLANINHPNIIRFYGASIKPPRVGIVMDYCSNGEILDFVRKQNPYPIKSKLRLLRELIAAIEYIHSRNIIHRDIKVENVLVDSNENCKLMDFGISRILEIGDDEKTKTKAIGSSFYIAPEIFSGKYTKKVDSFSFAILVWIVMTEIVDPYEEEDSRTLGIRVAANPELRPDIEKLRNCCFGKIGKNNKDDDDDGEWLIDAVTCCWNHDPGKRYDFTQLTNIFFYEEHIVDLNKEQEEEVKEENNSEDDDDEGDDGNQNRNYYGEDESSSSVSSQTEDEDVEESNLNGNNVGIQ